jgi:hypothetical protein
VSFRQWVRLPVTLSKIACAIREDCSASAADEYLQAFRGFHLEPDQPNFRARLWEPVTLSREAAEWSSSSTYTVMAAHSKRMLHRLLRNLARDEIKHLCILSAADAYLRGPRPWRRLGELLRIGASNYRGQQQRRSQGRQMGANVVTRVEVVVAHLLMEWRVRRWTARLPLNTLQTVFETDSPPIAPAGKTAEEQARIDARLALNRERRARLSRWLPAARLEATRCPKSN